MVRQPSTFPQTVFQAQDVSRRGFSVVVALSTVPRICCIRLRSGGLVAQPFGQLSSISWIRNHKDELYWAECCFSLKWNQGNYRTERANVGLQDCIPVLHSSHTTTFKETKGVRQCYMMPVHNIKYSLL